MSDERNTHEDGEVCQRRAILEKYRNLLVEMSEAAPEGIGANRENFPDVQVPIHDLSVMLNWLSFSLYGYHGTPEFGRCEGAGIGVPVFCMRCRMRYYVQQEPIMCPCCGKPTGLIPAPLRVSVEKRGGNLGCELIDRDLGPVEHAD